MYWTNVCQAAVRLQQNIFEKHLIEVGSLHLHSSFGSFCVQIGQLLEAQWVFEHSEESRNRRHFPSKTKIYRCSSILQRLTVIRIVHQFGRKRYQKNHNDLSYQLLKEFVQKYIVVHELWAGKNSFSTYICYTLDVLFW